MLKTYCKTILIAIFAVVLFGCGGEADEAKKLGFASVDEMKEAHAKGWHTKQKYEEDNQSLTKNSGSKEVIAKQLAETNVGASSEAAVERPSTAIGSSVNDAKVSWKEFKFQVGNLSFSVKFPDDEAIKSQSFSNYQYYSYHKKGEVFKLQVTKWDSPANGRTLEEKATAHFAKMKYKWARKPEEYGVSVKEIDVNGLRLIDASGTSGTFRIYQNADYLIEIIARPLTGVDLAEYAKNKSKVDYFLNSLTQIETGSKASETIAPPKPAMYASPSPNASYNLLAICQHPAASIGSNLAINLAQFSASNTVAFSTAITSKTYSQFCTSMSGKPSAMIIDRITQSQWGNFEKNTVHLVSNKEKLAYWVVDVSGSQNASLVVVMHKE